MKDLKALMLSFEFNEGFDVKLWVDGPSMTSDTPIEKSQKRISSWKAGYKTRSKLRIKKLII